MSKQVTFPKTITISVTQDDIDHGRAGSCENCPIALAAARKPYPFDSVIVSSHLLEYHIVGDKPHVGWMAYKLPAEAIKFIHMFDGRMYRDEESRAAALAVAPFTFCASRVDSYVSDNELIGEDGCDEL